MLDKLLSLEKNKYYGLDANIKSVESQEQLLHSIMFYYNDKLIFIGFEYAPFNFETIDTISSFTKGELNDLSGYKIVEVSEYAALNCFQFFMITEIVNGPIYLDKSISKEFFVNSLKYLINEFSSMLDEKEKESFELAMSNVQIVNNESESVC
jgi:hypothetical protein